MSCASDAPTSRLPDVVDHDVASEELDAVPNEVPDVDTPGEITMVNAANGSKSRRCASPVEPPCCVALASALAAERPDCVSRATALVISPIERERARSSDSCSLSWIVSAEEVRTRRAQSITAILVVSPGPSATPWIRWPSDRPLVNQDCV